MMFQAMVESVKLHNYYTINIHKFSCREDKIIPEKQRYYYKEWDFYLSVNFKDGPWGFLWVCQKLDFFFFFVGFLW